MTCRPRSMNTLSRGRGVHRRPPVLSWAGRRYVHQVIDHAESYAKGKVHTNGLENFWSLLKRGIKGTYVNVEPFHLFRYLDEQVFRFNNRKTKDVARFVSAVGQIIGKRLTYADLIGANAAPSTT